MHSHDHNRTQVNYSKVFLIGIILNAVYVAVELTFGIIINSMSLIADAGHNFSDVLGLILAWGASYLASTAVTKKKTYGMRKSTILAALFNSIILFAAVGAILIESVRKISEPQPVGGTEIMIVAGIGVIINTITAMLFIKGSKKDLNIKGAFLHMAADAGISLGVVAAGLVINLTGYFIIDPIFSIIIVIIITMGTWSLMKDSFMLSMDAVPEGINYKEVENYFLSLSGVEEVHDLHIWAMSTTENALTVHLVVPKDPGNDFLKRICNELKNKFSIDHPTIQIEKFSSSSNCETNSV